MGNHPQHHKKDNRVNGFYLGPWILTASTHFVFCFKILVRFHYPPPLNQIFRACMLHLLTFIHYSDCSVLSLRDLKSQI